MTFDLKKIHILEMTPKDFIMPQNIQKVVLNNIIL